VQTPVKYKQLLSDKRPSVNNHQSEETDNNNDGSHASAAGFQGDIGGSS